MAFVPSFLADPPRRGGEEKPDGSEWPLVMSECASHTRAPFNNSAPRGRGEGGVSYTAHPAPLDPPTHPRCPLKDGAKLCCRPSADQKLSLAALAQRWR